MMSLAYRLQCQVCLSMEDRTMPMYCQALSMSKDKLDMDKLIGKFLQELPRLLLMWLKQHSSSSWMKMPPSSALCWR